MFNTDICKFILKMVLVFLEQVVVRTLVMLIGKAGSLQAWSGPEGSRKLRFPDFMTTERDGGKVVSLMHRPPLPPGNTPGTIGNHKI